MVPLGVVAASDLRLILDLSALHYYLSCQKSVACASAEVEVRMGTVAQEAQVGQTPGIAAGLSYRVPQPLQRRPVGPAAGVDRIKAAIPSRSPPALHPGGRRSWRTCSS